MKWLRHHCQHVLRAALPLLFYVVVANRFSWRPRSLPRQANYSIVQVAFSPDGATLAAATRTKSATAGPDKVQLWDVDSGHLRHELAFWSDSLRSISFAPHGATLATLSYSSDYVEAADYMTQVSRHKLQWWDTGSGQLTRTVAMRTSIGSEGFNLAHWPGDGTLAFAVPVYGLVCFNGTTSNWQHPWVPDKLAPTVLSPDGHTLAQGVVVTDVLMDGVRLWDARTPNTRRLLALDGSRYRDAAAHAVSVDNLTFSPSGRIIAGELAVATPANTVSGTVSDYDVRILLWNTETGNLLQSLKGFDGRIRALTLAPGGAMLAVADASKNVNLWDVHSGTLLRTLAAHRAVVNTVAFSPDGATLASGDDAGCVKLWRVR